MPNWIVGWTELHPKSIENQMKGEIKSYKNWVDVYLLKWLSWIEFLICWWQSVLHIATSWYMDWQKYPKSRMSIRIQQSETLDSIKCHTFPGLGGRPLDIRLQNSILLFVPKVLIEIQAHTNNFFVFYNGVEYDFMACECISQPVWLATSRVLPSQLDAWPKAVSGQHSWLRQAGWRAAGQPICLSCASSARCA